MSRVVPGPPNDSIQLSRRLSGSLARLLRLSYNPVPTRPTFGRATDLLRSMASPSRTVATRYNAAKTFRILVFERDDGSFGYYFEYLIDLSDEPVRPIPEIWVDDNLPRNSGAYDSVESAVQEARRDSVWVQHHQTT